jgi:hypothetical protein
VSDQKTLELYREYPSPNEQEVADEIVTLLKQQMIENTKSGKMLRDVHTKGHGGVVAEFTVASDLPDELRVGVFKQPRTFPAIIRYSSTCALAPIGTVCPDYWLDARGMAIKLIGVEGEKLLEGEQDALTQDFVLFSPQMFFAADPENFYELTVALVGSALGFLWYLLSHPVTAYALFLSLRVAPDLLGLSYFSAVPYRFGQKAVKYSTKPAKPGERWLPLPPSENFLRQRMKARLAKEDVVFEFRIQFQTDPYRMPIENAQKVWSQKLSPFVRVATIRIPKQSFDSPAQLDYCENLSFNPWHSLAEHRPLGSISRARHIVYNAISQFRHSVNKVPRREPTPESFRQYVETTS